MIMAYQLDPWAIDIDKVSTAEYNGTAHELTFPSYIKPGYIAVPLDPATVWPKVAVAVPG